MHALYKKEKEDFELYCRKTKYIRPSLHASLEIVYVAEGSTELGVGVELHHMEKGDLGIVFPNQIHHYQVFSEKGGTAYYILAAPSLLGNFIETMETAVPEDPVIPAEKVHPDIRYALKALKTLQEENGYAGILQEAYLQIMLSRIFPHLKLQARKARESDLVDRVVTYIAAHYMEPVTLASMAKDLYVNPFALSRVFAQAFGMNFNRYLNLTRLEYSRHLLEDTDRPVTEICLDAGFGSQRTFNRVFREEYHITPAEYRKENRSSGMIRF